MSNETYKLTYFNFRGIAEPIRFIFALKGVEFQDERLPMDENWPDAKKSFPWGTVPVLEIRNSKTDSTFKLAQCAAICRFLAKKFGLFGKTDEDCAKCDEYVDAMKDFGQEYIGWFRAKDETVKSAKMDEIKEKHVPFYYEKFDQILAKNGSGWLVGDKLTWADLYVAHNLNAYAQFGGSGDQLLKEYSNVGKLVDKVFSLEGIAKWIKERPETPF